MTEEKPIDKKPIERSQRSDASREAKTGRANLAQAATDDGANAAGAAATGAAANAVTSTAVSTATSTAGSTAGSAATGTITGTTASDLADAHPSELSNEVVHALAVGRLQDPFGVLGPHEVPGQKTSRSKKKKTMMVRVFVPGALRVEVVVQDKVLGELQAHAQANPLNKPQAGHDATGLFSGALALPIPETDQLLAACYRLRVTWPGQDGGEVIQESADPYAFGLLLGDLDLHLISEGRHQELGACLGAQVMEIGGIAGVRFAVWAPNAQRVSVVGDFNGWDGRRHPMRLRHSAGVWELFIPQGLGAQPGERYKYEIVSRDGVVLPHRADPVARQTEAPPATASVIADPAAFEWQDTLWLERRAAANVQNTPMSVYEVHVGSWMRNVNDPEHGWDRLAEQLIPYAKGLGFTHIELMPVMEHPFGGSWGYQPLSQFAPTARYGSPREFARFIDRCHVASLGVILDWVPAHFPTDAHGLGLFDGTALYEYADPREGFHRDWDTMIYNLGRNEVHGFMIASALFWLEHFHVDALRVDAVASMLYRDYSREAGEWIPNQFGGRENLESVAFLRELNRVIVQRCPGALTIAEESTAWPGVTRPVEDGGLGFALKWNMGWMHDTLRYMEYEPIHRAWHHNDMSFGLVYAWSEKFILPLSHDEVVHGKGSLLGKMPGDRWQQFANLRAYYAFMWAHPGKKLLFMGGEIGQYKEWNHDGEIEWPLLEHPEHLGVQRLVTDLNQLLAQTPALYRLDHEPAGFGWVVGDDDKNSVFAFFRYAEPPHEQNVVLVVCNFTPVPRAGYRIGVPFNGVWQESLNTDAQYYGGSNTGNAGAVQTDAIPAHGHPASLTLTLPPLSTVIFKYNLVLSDPGHPGAELA